MITLTLAIIYLLIGIGTYLLNLDDSNKSSQGYVRAALLGCLIAFILGAFGVAVWIYQLATGWWGLFMSSFRG